ncbi:MAG: hypothetical protein WAN66_02065 [Limnoraphis robusta]
MRTSALDIYSTPQQHNPRLFSVGKAKTQYWENFYNLKSPKLHSNSTSNSELILAQVRLDAIESELATACSRYIQLCQELDAMTFQNERDSCCCLDLEREKTSHEILAMIQEIGQLELERIHIKFKLSSLTSNRESIHLSSY